MADHECPTCAAQKRRQPLSAERLTGVAEPAVVVDEDAELADESAAS